MSAHCNREPQQQCARQTKAAVSHALQYVGQSELRQEGNHEHARHHTLELGEVLPVWSVKINQQIGDETDHDSYKHQFDENCIACLCRPYQLPQSPGPMKA